MDAAALSDPIASAQRLRRSFFLVLSFVILLWLVKLADSGLSLHLVRFGLYPHTLGGLGGILWAPLIHGSFSHLFANTAPLVVLGTALLYGYPHSARIALPAIYLGSGVGVWLFARSAYHIGASGLTFGMMFFVFTIGALRWDKRAIALSLIVFFLYGGMIWGIFPTAPGISFEYHFFGALLGVTLAVVLKTRDPAPPEKKYSWEEEAEGPDELMDLFPPETEEEEVGREADRPDKGSPPRLH
jgi:membrane associated rhomboid family serine protease